MVKVNVGTNWIRDLYYDPCDPDPWIFIELAFPAVIQAIWEYIQWDWEDYYEAVRGKSWQKDLKGRIRASHWQPPKWVSRGTMFLFIAEAGVQRLGWMLMVAEILADAFIRWASLIASLPKCDETINRDWGRSKSPIDGRPLNHEWQVGAAWTTEAGTMFPYVYSTFTVPARGAAYFTTFQRYASFPVGTELKVETRLVCLTDNTVLFQAPPNDPADEQNRSSAIHGKVRNQSDSPKTYQFQVRLIEGQSPLVWNCVGDFISVSIFEAFPKVPDMSLPYVPLPQPNRRTANKRPYNRKNVKPT